MNELMLAKENLPESIADCDIDTLEKVLNYSYRKMGAIEQAVKNHYISNDFFKYGEGV